MATFTRTPGDPPLAIFDVPDYPLPEEKNQSSTKAQPATEAPDPALEALAAETKKLAIDELQMQKESDEQPPLLRLPPELRNEIGALVLLRSEELPLPEIFEASSLLRVCSRLRRNLRSMFLAVNTFSLDESALVSRTKPEDRGIEGFGRRCLEAFSAREHCLQYMFTW